MTSDKEITKQVEADFAYLQQPLASFRPRVVDMLQVYGDQETAVGQASGAKIVIVGTMAYTPPHLVNPMPSDILRIGVPIMRPGFITVTGLMQSSAALGIGSSSL